MNRKAISPLKAAKLKAKAHSIAQPMPATRNPDGSIKNRDKTGGAAARKAATAAKGAAPVKPATPQLPPPVPATIAGIKPGNGKHPETLAQVAAAGETVSSKGTEGAQVELAPAVAVELPVNFLAAALSIAPKKDTRFYLNGVYIHQVGEQLRIVATDGHRMFVAHIPQAKEIAWATAGVILPREELDRVLRFTGKEANLAVEFGTEHPAVTIREPGGLATFKLRPVDGKFPDYQRAVDAASKVFATEREELSQSTIDSAYMKAAGAIAATLGSKSVIPFLAPEDASYASVFAFSGCESAALYIMGQRSRSEALPAPTVKLFGKASIEATIAQLDEAAKKSREIAARCKRDHFRDASNNKADRLEARAAQLRAAISVKLEGPKPAAESAPAGEAKPEGATAH